MKTIGNTFFIFLRNNACVFTENIKAQNKNQIPLLDSLISCISAKSAPQILSIKDECTPNKEEKAENEIHPVI